MIAFLALLDHRVKQRPIEGMNRGFKRSREAARTLAKVRRNPKDTLLNAQVSQVYPYRDEYHNEAEAEVADNSESCTSQTGEEFSDGPATAVLNRTITKKERSSSNSAPTIEISNIKRADEVNYAAAGQAKLRRLGRPKMKHVE